MCLTQQSTIQMIYKIRKSQNSKCLEQEFWIVKKIRQCLPSMPNKTICNSIIKYILTSSKFQLPCAKISIPKVIRQCTPCVPKEIFCDSIDQEYLEEYKIPPALSNIFYFKLNRQYTLCIPDKRTSNPIDQDFLDKFKT